jgi:hypothetical protein
MFSNALRKSTSIAASIALVGVQVGPMVGAFEFLTIGAFESVLVSAVKGSMVGAFTGVLAVADSMEGAFEV